MVLAVCFQSYVFEFLSIYLCEFELEQCATLLAWLTLRNILILLLCSVGHLTKTMSGGESSEIMFFQSKKYNRMCFLL